VAQLRGCGVTDARCLDEAYSGPCLAKETPWPETCEALLEELLRYPTGDSEPEILAKAAFAHHMLADAAESAADAASREQAAGDLYRRVITLDPNHADAYLGLAGLADDLSERIEWLREALRARGTNSIGSRGLASALDERGTREDRLEAAAVTRAAYEAEPWGRHKWYLGATTLRRYTSLGLASAARQFVDTVVADIGIDRLLDALERAASDAEAAIDALKTLCYHSVIDIVGANACIDGIGVALETAGSASAAAVADRLAQEGLMHMRSIPITRSGRVDRPGEIVSWLEQLEATGHESFELYFALGRCYIDLGRNGEAVAALAEAYALATGYWRDEINRYVAIARDPDWYSPGHPVCVPQDTIVVE
jgi:tetratricopeptide (TPR) repeat protein